MRALKLTLLALVVSVAPAWAQGQQGVPRWPGVTMPTFIIPASAVNGGGQISTTCLTWPLGTPLCEDAVNVLDQRNGTAAQRFRVANTYTSAISNELFSVDWQTQANVALVGTRTAATGTIRPLRLVSQAASGGDQYAMLQIDRTSFPLFRMGLANGAGTFLSSTSGTGNFIQLGEVTSTATSGPNAIVAIIPTYNQSSGAAANTDLLIQRTETAIGSGAQYAIQTQRSSTNQFTVTAGSSGKGLQIGTAQAAVPTCTSNCGTSPSVVGSDTAMTVTMGGTGSPTSGFVVTFNGTWPAAPSCTGAMAKTGMAVGKLPMVIVTTTTTLTVTTNGVAPANSDVYHFHCLGVQ